MDRCGWEETIMIRKQAPFAKWISGDPVVKFFAMGKMPLLWLLRRSFACQLTVSLWLCTVYIQARQGMAGQP